MVNNLQTTNSISSVITLIIGISISVLVLIFVGTLGGQTYSLVEADIEGIGYHSVVGQTITIIDINTTGSPMSFSVYDIIEGTVRAYNSTGTEVGLGTFTIDYAQGLLEQTNATEDRNLTGMNVLFNYSYGQPNLEGYIQSGIVSSFDALEQTGSYLPIIVLAVVIFLVLSMVLGFTAIGGGMGRNAL